MGQLLDAFVKAATYFYAFSRPIFLGGVPAYQEPFRQWESHIIALSWLRVQLQRLTSIFRPALDTLP